jgi:Na+-transporting NADH:ubiquinone oxidoreductase subunit F
MPVFEVGIAAGVFTSIVMTLVAAILAARRLLVAAGDVEVFVNGERRLRGGGGRKLIDVLADNDIHLSAACGGRGTCGLCRVRVTAGGGAPLPVEMSHLSPADLHSGIRLSCQLTLHDDLSIEVAKEILGVRRLRCRVRTNRNVATLMKELILELPAGETFEFVPGAYVQAVCPPHTTRFVDFDIGPEYRAEWDRLKLSGLEVRSPQPAERAYSIASHPGERGIVMLLIRIATPPAGAPPSAPPGVVSSYLFGLKPGDMLEIAGPYGEFRVNESDREMIFIGGGTGMAPLRSMIFDQLRVRRTARRMSYWYGARSGRELFYRDEFDRLQSEFSNFRWHAALSEPAPDEAWTGARGFIHQVVFEQYLGDHPSPEECEYYLCGPPPMIKAVRAMLDGLGVEAESIRFDDFGV